MQKKFEIFFLIWRYLDLNWLRETLVFTERQYLSSGVNMLTNSLKISDTTKNEFFEMIFFLNEPEK